MTKKNPSALTKAELRKATQEILLYCLNNKDRLKPHQIAKWTPPDLCYNHEVLNRATVLYRDEELKRIKYLKLVLKDRKATLGIIDEAPQKEAA